ncbi:MAG: autotransporter domain-containing protein, partial [Rhodospirillaceae bacterium]|nr:autotransporter domain-containing protein [Rhodospirillaceae bacterium]
MASLAGGGRDEIFNRGTIVGDVDLGGGDDAFIAFAGSSLAGRLSGGAGSDRLNFFGGGTVDFMTDGIENMVMVADEGLIVRGRLDITDTAALVSGELTVAAGGRLQARQILVSRGARLTGPGTVAGAVALQGELAPGPGIGTLAIDGDVTHEAGSTLRIDLGPGRTGDRLVLTGQARLGGTLALTSPSGVFYRGGESYDIIVAGRGIDGAFDRITELSSAFLRTATALSTDRRTLSLLVERIPYASAARTLNGAAAAGALDQALNGNRAALQATFSALDSMPLAEAAASFERLASPLPVALSSAAEVAGRAMHDSLDRWLARAPTAERWQAWGHAQRSEGGPTEKRTRGQGTAYAYRGVTQTAGFDARIGDTARAGLALGRADVDLRLRAQPAQADIEQTSLAAYAGAAWSAVRVGGGIVVGDGDADLSRPSSLDAARSVASQTDIDSRNAFVSAATAIATGAFVFEPDLGMTYARTKIDGYRETGPLALQIGPQRHTSARLEAGALLTTRHQTVRPVLLLRASRELHARHATVRASLMDDPTAPFDIIGVVPRKTWLTGSFSLAADVTDALSLRLGVEGNLTDSIGGRSVFAGAALRW